MFYYRFIAAGRVGGVSCVQSGISKGTVSYKMDGKQEYMQHFAMLCMKKLVGSPAA